MKPAHLAPKPKSNLKNTIAITAITALLASGVAVVSMPASATTATALTDGQRLNFAPTAEDYFAATSTSQRVNGVDDTTGTIWWEAVTGDTYRYKNVHPTFSDVDALVTVESISNAEDDHMDYLDLWSSDSVDNAFIAPSLDSEVGSSYATSRIKVEFFVSGTSNRVTFPSLGVNAYDIDSEQYIDFEGHSSYQLFSSTHLQRQTISPGVERFVAPNTSTSTSTFGVSTAYTIGRVKANYTNAHTVVFTLGAWGGSFFELDFGPGASWGANNEVPPQTNAGSDPGSSSGGSSSPVKTVTDISPTQISPNREIVTLTGQNLDTTTEVFIGGVKARIVSKANGTLTVKPPKGLKGFVDVELKGTLNPVSRIKALEYLRGKAAEAVRKAEIVVGGFDHNSRVLTSRIKTRIERLIDKYPELLTVTCTGFTSLPRRANDVRLSTNRGVEACRFAKAYKPSLVVEVEQGIEDPRPGSNVRRVRVALSQ